MADKKKKSVKKKTKSKRKIKTFGPVQLMDEAVLLLKQIPIGHFIIYYLGTLPFIIVFLYFWIDQSIGNFADEHALLGAVVLAVLYLFMKVLQANFCALMYNKICGMNEKIPWSKQSEIVVTQCICQPICLVLTVLTFFTFFLTPVFMAFSNSLLVFSATGLSHREATKKARSHSVLRYDQNVCSYLFICLIILLIVVNCLLLLFFLPMLIKAVLDSQHILVQNPQMIWNIGFLNMTVLISTLLYIVFDPYIKALYVIRIFYIESKNNAGDLLEELRAIRAVRPQAKPGKALMLLLFCFFMINSDLQASQAENRFDDAIDKTMSETEFSWRMPKELTIPDENLKPLERFVETINKAVKGFVSSIGDLLESIVNWISSLFPKTAPTTTGSWFKNINFQAILMIVFYIVLFLLLGFLVFVLLKIINKYKKSPKETKAHDFVHTERPDLMDEAVTADELADDQWMIMADEKMNDGEYLLALRAMYLSLLSGLGERGFIRIRKFKSNKDYCKEIDRRARSVPRLMEIFSENVLVFEESWYGLYTVDKSILLDFRKNIEKIRQRTHDS
ncbi:MAG: hypothetical protein HRT89_14675 [Lentisphaeria bacterium]|nr:hypothetical protein [Lentisphaeria bacterium]NQZ69303.1 hypothetical protein [Lentisphaeria bacterium]